MDKTYVVANKEQELDVLKKFELDGLVWIDGEKPTSWVPSDKMFVMQYVGFPYALSCRDGSIIWVLIENIEDQTIVYDGRKEEKMSKKYLVTQEFMDKLSKWRNDLLFLTPSVIRELPELVEKWLSSGDSANEYNKRFGAIIGFVNGEDVFETQKTYKYYIARTSSPVIYFSMKKWYHSEFPKYDTISSEKKVFDTREEAEKWLIPGYEVVEIDGNEL